AVSRVPARAILGMLVVALAATLISACGSSKSSPPAKKVNLNISHVVLSIEQSILAERHLHAKVSCPVAVPQEKGQVFTCTATGITNGKHKTRFTTPFTVTVQNNQGYVTYAGQRSS
ncbi:MAG TPA: hypothetical protein VGF15_06620, partial [Solirubrobacteraceae bacterium]